MSQETAAAATTPHYGIYWKIWVLLLAITVGMLFVHNAFVIIVGIACKALIIMLWYMHLKDEHRDLITTVIVGIFATCLVMYLLMAQDAAFM